MKSSEFGSALNGFARVLEVAGAQRPAALILELAKAFDANGAVTVAALIKRVSALPKPPDTGRPNLSEVARLLSPLREFLSSAGKAGVVTDLGSVEALLNSWAAVDLAAFVRVAAAPPQARVLRKAAQVAVNEKLVADFFRRLETALGNDKEFATVYDDLRSNDLMGKAELTLLVKQLTGVSPRTKPDALKKIFNRHQALMGFEAKARATRGRSAA